MKEGKPGHTRACHGYKGGHSGAGGHEHRRPTRRFEGKVSLGAAKIEAGTDWGMAQSRDQDAALYISNTQRKIRIGRCSYQRVVPFDGVLGETNPLAG